MSRSRSPVRKSSSRSRFDIFGARKPLRRGLSGKRLNVENLEERRLLAVSPTFHNDNWHLVADNDASSSVTSGDTVRNDNDTIATGTIVKTYGVDAFGTVTTGAFTGSDPAFDNIQEAITNTTAGGILNVLEGSYTENFSILNAITLRGAQFGADARGRVAAETVLNSASAASPTINVAFNGTPIIDGFSFVGGPTGASGVIFTSVGPNDNMQIINNRFSNFPAAAVWMNRGGSDITIDRNDMDGSNIAGGGQVIFSNGPQSYIGLNITNNNVYNAPGRYGYFVDGNHNVGESATRAPLISGNLFNNLLQGLNLGSRSFGTLGAPVLGPFGGTISNNTFSNNAANGIQAGIQHVLVTRNSFTNNAITGLALTSFGNTGADRGAQNSVITENFFSGNVAEDLFFSASQGAGLISTNVAFRNSFGSTIAVTYNETVPAERETLQVSGNWWGTASNPEAAGKIGGASSHTVDYSPWLNSGTDTDGGTPGFQGSLASLHVDDDSAFSTLAYDSVVPVASQYITEGIALLTGSPLRLQVHNGTYLENVDVNKALTFVPGDSPGIVNITGNYTFSVVGSTLEMEVNGTTPGVPLGHDQINVSGIVDLNGADNIDNKVTLTVSSTTASTILDVYDIITSAAGPIQGQFANPGNVVVSTGVVNTFLISYNPGGQNLVRLVSQSGGPPTTTYADDDWFGLQDGTFIADVDPVLAGSQIGYIGINAFDTIQEAVDAVAVGGTVKVNQHGPDQPGSPSGAYDENVSITKALTLDGNGGATGTTATAVVIDPTAGVGISIASPGNNVTIQDLRVTGATDGISASGVSGLTLTNLQADTNSDDGIELSSLTGAPTITSVTASTNGDDGLAASSLVNLPITGNFFTNNSGDGVDLLNVSNVTFEDNLVSGQSGAGDDGLRLNNVAGISVLGSTFTGNATGVHVQSGNTGVEIGPDTVVPADSNTFTVPNQAGGAVGVLVSAGQSADIQNNTTGFTGTAGANIDTGILLDHAGDTTIDGNTFNGLYQAVRIISAANPASTVIDIISNHFNQGGRGPGSVTDGLGIVITGEDAAGTNSPAGVQINGRGRDTTHNVFRDYGGTGMVGNPTNAGYAVTLKDFTTLQISTLDYDALCNDWHAGPTPPEKDVPARIEDMIFDKLDDAALGRVFAVSVQVTEVRLGAFRDLPTMDLTTDLQIFPRELLPSTIVDDGDASFAASAGFTTFAGQGFQGDVRSAAGDNSGDAATWSFTGLKPGEWVELAVTWTAQANRATNAQYTILDNIGGTVLLTPPTINQQGAPNDFFTKGTNWEFLTTEIQVPASGTLVVRLTDNANNFVIADAVRLQQTRQFELVQVKYYQDVVNADNVNNYLLVADGVDNVHQTQPYDRTLPAPPFGVAGDDREVDLAAVPQSPFLGVVYNQATQTATLALAKDLDIDHYRLLINADPVTGVRGNTNNATIDPFLDGDGDNCDTGDDFAMDFTVSRRFDFNLAASVDDPAQSPTQPNYLAVQPQLVFGSTNDLDGYGWQTALPNTGFNRAGPDSLRRDGHFDSVTRTFRVDLDPGTGVSTDGNGTYTVTVHMGDQNVARDFMQVFAEGSAVASLQNVTTAAGQFVSLQFDVTVSDGVLDLRFADAGGSDVFWVVNGIELVPTAGEIPIVLTTPSSIIPGHVATITSQPIPHKADGSLITVTPNLGQIVTPDAAPNIQGHQVVVMGGVISFDIQAPLGSAATIIDNSSVSGFSTAGSWTPFAGQGYQNSVTYSAAGTGSDVATWSFSNLTPGQYAVSTTWSAQANRATNAPYTIRDGGPAGPVLNTTFINQEVAPNDFNDQGVPWENLAIVTITGSTMTVQLSDLANEFVIADAVRIQRVGGPVGSLEIKAVDVVGEARGTTVFPITQPADDLFFDLDSSSNATEPGYLGLNNTNNGFNFALGYGWSTLATTFDRGAGNPTQLLRDGHYGSADNTFKVQLDPAATYQVTLRFRDTFNRDGMQVFVEANVSPQFTLNLPANTTNVQTFSVGPLGGDGVLDLRFHDTWSSGGGGDPFWIVNAIEIDRTSPLMAAVTSSAYAGPNLTQSQVDAVLHQTLDIWSAALGQPVPQINVAIADLSGNLLGIASGNTITLDLSAAGVGWFIDTTPEDDSEFALADSAATQRYDLLTVLLHEIGHVLGLDHDDSDAPNVMDDVLLPGIRKLPGLQPSTEVALIDEVLAAWEDS